MPATARSSVGTFVGDCSAVNPPADRELAQGFADHLEETRQHVENLKRAFEELGEPVKAEKCPGIEGIKKEHDEFVANESPSPQVLDAFLTGAGARTEHYEIAAYEGLITMATRWARRKCQSS